MPVSEDERGLTESDAETKGPGAAELLGVSRDVPLAQAATAQPASLTCADNGNTNAQPPNAQPPNMNPADPAAAGSPTGDDACAHADGAQCSDVAVCPFTGKSSGAATGSCPFSGTNALRGAALNHEPHARSEPPYDDDSAYLGNSASEQLESLWQRLLEARRPAGEEDNVKFPSLISLHKELLGDRSYERLLKSREDVKESSKALCAVGAAARARIEWEQGDVDVRARFTGLFGGDEAVEGLLRLSTACEPPSSSSSVPMPLRGSLRLFGGGLGSARLFPCAAFKALRDGSPSGNLLFAGRKVGHASTSFFDSHIATCVTEKASTFLKPFMAAFRKYSAYPTHMGLSDFASAATDGKKVVDPVFPWALVLRPTEAARRFGADTQKAVDERTAFLIEIARIPPGTPLYEIYAIPSPSSALEGVSKDGSERLHKIGRITTTSEFVFSDADGTMCFWHQRKEEDYALRPDWERALTPAHAQSCGAEHFARLIAKGNQT
uniref:Uncharacterized protein n=1 Tax=Chrysotila carterae TaxID=13221 RepID=A0A7S4C635_CHRCT